MLFPGAMLYWHRPTWRWASFHSRRHETCCIGSTHSTGRNATDEGQREGESVSHHRTQHYTQHHTQGIFFSEFLFLLSLTWQYAQNAHSHRAHHSAKQAVKSKKAMSHSGQCSVSKSSAILFLCRITCGFIKEHVEVGVGLG